MKTCTICKRELPLDQYYPTRKGEDRLQPYCKECTSARRKKWVALPGSRDKQHAAQLKWRQQDKNKDRLQAIGKRYRDRKKAQTIQIVDRAEVYRRDAGICHICGGMVDWSQYEVDHVIPISEGGLECYGNVRVSHKMCNKRKHNIIGYELPYVLW